MTLCKLHSAMKYTQTLSYKIHEMIHVIMSLLL